MDRSFGTAVHQTLFMVGILIRKAATIPEPLTGGKLLLTTEEIYTVALSGSEEGGGIKCRVVHTSFTCHPQQRWDQDSAVLYRPSVDVASGDVIQSTVALATVSLTHQVLHLTFGDSPWYAGLQHERFSGVLRGIKIFNKSLSESDVLAEAASDSLATGDGIANIWYMNINPTPSDISDKSGKGHHPAWADPNNKASLWTGP